MWRACWCRLAVCCAARAPGVDASMVCRYFRPEGFRVAGENELLGLLDLIDSLYLRYDGLTGAAVVFRGCVVA